MNVIFHHPLPLDIRATSASGIRPLKMLEAFRSLGYSIDVIDGYSDQRLASIKSIKAKIKSGIKYDFVYAESSTQPTTLTDRHHLPLHPWLDAGFFYFCKKSNIPIGLFYRDIYWKFDAYGKGLSFWKVLGAKLAYYYDLIIYRSTLTKLYLPSLKMGEFVPVVPEEFFEALPPGHSRPTLVGQPISQGPLKLFYVGGMSDHYRMHTLFAALHELPQVQLIVCTRAAEWQAVRAQYEPLPANVNIIHESGLVMEKYLEACDMASLFVEPQAYWEFASPVKLYEYIGFQKPILASKGTLAGSVVASNGIGWSLPYTKESIIDFFSNVQNNMDRLRQVHENLTLLAPHHTWRSRAEQVVEDLTQ